MLIKNSFNVGLNARQRLFGVVILAILLTLVLLFLLSGMNAGSARANDRNISQETFLAKGVAEEQLSGQMQPTGNPEVEILLQYNYSTTSPGSFYRILFVPDERFGVHMEAVSGVAHDLTSKGLMNNSVTNINRKLWGIYVTNATARVIRATGKCPVIHLSPQVFQGNDGSKVPYDVIVVLHLETGVWDCAKKAGDYHLISIGVKSIESGQYSPNAPRILVHEIGHAFGLPDGYNEAANYEVVPPVLYSDKTECEIDPQNSDWRPQEGCTMLRTADHTATFWRSQNHIDIMNAQGSDVLEFGKGDWFILRKALTSILTNFDKSYNREVRAPKKFAPDDWLPPDDVAHGNGR